MKKICWITPDYFLIVDAPKVPELALDFEIDWKLIVTYDTERKPDGLFHDFKPEMHVLKFRQRDPRLLIQYLRILIKIKKSDPDLIYLSFHGFPYFFPLFFIFFNPRKVIWGVHNIINPKGSYREKWMDLYQDYIFKRIRNVHVFSRYQLSIVQKMFPDKKHFCIPLTLEDYGVSKVTPPMNSIRFIFFGYIEKYKGVDLLIHAFSELQERNMNVELVIAGTCSNWSPYKSLINCNKKIILIEGPIDNKDIPDLISSCHYVVLPYLEGTQSGVLRLAYRYNRPVIVSDIESFRQSVSENISGYFFSQGSQASLTDTMQKVVLGHAENYVHMRERLKSFVDSEYNLDSIIEQYRGMLSECLES